MTFLADLALVDRLAIYQGFLLFPARLFWRAGFLFSMAIKRDQIQSLTVDEPLKIELLGLFDEIGAKEHEISALRSKVPSDSQKVVSDVDFTAYTQAVKELAELRAELAKKAGDAADKAPNLNDETWLAVFSNFFAE